MTGYVLLFFVIYFLLNLIVANFFQNIAALKGYGQEVHSFGMVFFFGIIGCIYVAALPDKVRQEQNQEIINLLSESKEVE